MHEMIKTLMLTMNKEYSFWWQTAGGLDMGEWERADCVFYLNAAIHHEVTRELTSHLRRLIMDPPLWIWLISSLFQIYYNVRPKVEMQWMVRTKLQSTKLFTIQVSNVKINTVNINRFDNKSPYLFKVKDNNYNFRQRD